MIAQIGGLLIDTAGGLLVLALLLRFYMQAVRAPFRSEEHTSELQSH